MRWISNQRGPDRTSWSVFSALLLGTLCVSIAGCGDGLSAVPVSGQVTLDDEPLANADVSFQPVSSGASKGVPGAFGATDSSGNYSLKTSTKPSKDGAVPGEYVVRITLRGNDEDDSGLAQSEGPRLPLQAGDGSLTFEVPGEGAEAADFHLKSK